MQADGDLITVLIAEDEATVRGALADLISGDGSLELVGAAADADQAIDLAREHRPDVALLDVKMPGGGGPRASREIRSLSPETRVVALSAYEDRFTVLEMLRAGASGYLVKGASAGEILEAIRRSVRGQASLSTEVTADVISELVILLDRSERMARELRGLDRMKSEMIQVLSHELMTPITVIQGVAGMMSSGFRNLTEADVQVLAESVSGATERLRRLVGNLGATAKLDREQAGPRTESIQVGEVISQAAGEFPGRADRLRLPPPEDSKVEIRADLELAMRALVMLLDNAFGFAPEDEAVDVEVEAAGAEVRVHVADRGPGIPQDLQSAVFQAFTQADSSITRPHEGLGIGLYLARRIMAAHGGRIEMAPRPGGGSVFTLVFPG